MGGSDIRQPVIYQVEILPTDFNVNLQKVVLSIKFHHFASRAFKTL